MKLNSKTLDSCRLFQIYQKEKRKKKTHACAPASCPTTPAPPRCLRAPRWSTGPRRWSCLGCWRDPRPPSELSWSILWSSGQSGTSPCSCTSRCTQKTCSRGAPAEGHPRSFYFVNQSQPCLLGNSGVDSGPHTTWLLHKFGSGA